MNRVEERDKLTKQLLDAVKQCQTRFGGRSELATEFDIRVKNLCQAFEDILNHGLRRTKNLLNLTRQVVRRNLPRSVSSNFNSTSAVNTDEVNGYGESRGGSSSHATAPALSRSSPDSSSSSIQFWHFVRLHLNKHEHERYLLLKHVRTDIGRGRAWLRSSLNEHSLERYILMMLSNDFSMRSQFYEDWAFLMDDERTSILPQAARGLQSILFAINIDNRELNGPLIASTSIDVGHNIRTDPLPVVVAGSASSVLLGGDSYGRKGRTRKPRHRRPPRVQVISFDDDDDVDGGDDDDEDDHSIEQSSDKESKGSESNSYCEAAQSAPATCVSSPESTSKAILAKTLATNSDSPTSFEPFLNEPAPSSPLVQAESHLEVIEGSDVDENSGEPPQEAKNANVSSNLMLTPLSQNDNGASEPNLDNVMNTVQVNHAKDMDRGVDNGSLEKSQDTLKSSESPAPLPIDGELETRSTELNQISNETKRLIAENASLKEELEALRSKYEEKLSKVEHHLDIAVKENDTLKDQLKRYIEAVQLLEKKHSDEEDLSEVESHDQSDENRDDAQVKGDHSRESQDTASSSISHSAHHEAAEYEKKLVQVAEMHGELVEFNDRLHKVILQKEFIIRRLREELTELRGPLPDGSQSSDDEMSLTSDLERASQAMAKPLINIWIPTAFLAGQTSSNNASISSSASQAQQRKTGSHHVYQIYVRIKDEEWNVYRRYSQFYAFHKLMKKKHPVIHTFDFPPKKTIGNKGAKIVQERRKRLENYLRCVANFLQREREYEIYNKATLTETIPFFCDRVNNPDVRSASDSQINVGSNQSGGAPTSSAQSAQRHYMGL